MPNLTKGAERWCVRLHACKPFACFRSIFSVADKVLKYVTAFRVSSVLDAKVLYIYYREESKLRPMEVIYVRHIY